MDWKKLVAELDAAGYTQAAIATHCGVAQSTVSDLARGATKSPGFEFGRKLIELRDSVCQSGETQAVRDAA